MTAVSLVVCTRNRGTQLRKCLCYIERLRPICVWELILVDNGSTDATREILSDFAAGAAFPVTVLFEARAGLGRARNTGWRAAKGDVIAFTDDDCYVAPDYIDRICEIFEDRRIGFAGGRVDLFDTNDCAFTLRTSDEIEFREPRSLIEPPWIIGASMAFRRRALEDVEGFDDNLGAGTRFKSGEDLDALVRASFAGWWGVYNPAAAVAHHHGRKATDIPSLKRGYLLGKGACTMKFILTPETRSLHVRNWYWTFLRVLRGGYALRDFLWELRGGIAYFAYRLRRHVTQLT